MTDQRRFEVNDKVCDHAQLSGEVIAVWGDAVKVHWNNGAKSWIAGARIRLRHAEGDAPDDHPLLQMGEDLRPTTLKAKRRPDSKQ